MNKTKFLELVKDPDLIEERDLTKLDELISEHPYSQIIHVLKVKGHKVFNRPDLDESLNLAATYTYDRGILRSILEGSQQAEYDADTVSTADLETDESEVEETSDFEWIHEGDDDDIFVDEITEATGPNIQELREEEKASGQDLGLKDESLQEESVEELQSPAIEAPESFTDEEQEPATGEEQDATEDELPDSLVEESKPPEAAESEPLSVEKNDSIEEETKTIDTPEQQKLEQVDEESSNQSEETEVEEKDLAEVPENTEKPVKDLLELEIEASSIHAELMKNLNELQENKQQYIKEPEKSKSPENLEEQIEIIDNFIKNSPVLSKPNLNAESEGTSQDDLSKKSTKLNNELVTENLARIYIKQGKGKDAEKIYKRLIRKFPQKKAYFADQIQKIKKK